MTDVWAGAALWFGLALVATLLSIRLRVATALSEIVVGTVAQLLIEASIGTALLGTSEAWITFLSGTGAILLTFLAGAELDPTIFRTKWKESVGIGFLSFLVPFLGCAAFAAYVLHWTPQASWLAGVALSTTSVAVVYAVMLELGLNSTDFGKALLAACFVTDLGTVLALGLIFAPFTLRTVAFVGVGAAAMVILPWEVETQATLESATEHYEAAYENLRRRAEDRGLTLETRILVGHPAEQIIRLAADTHVDLVVVGHRGRSRISEWVFGSVSKRVVNHAPCSVLVVRSR